jgi:hypothetical protein
MDKIVCFATSDFGGAHSAFRLMIKSAVRRYGFLLRTLPIDICRSYLAIACRAICIAVFRILGVSQDIQTLGKLNSVKRKLSLSTELGGLNAPSLELDAKHTHYYASFNANRVNLITNYESDSLGPMYGLIHNNELFHVATSTKPWAVQMRAIRIIIRSLVWRAVGIRSRGVD